MKDATEENLFRHRDEEENVQAAKRPAPQGGDILRSAYEIERHGQGNTDHCQEDAEVHDTQRPVADAKPVGVAHSIQPDHDLKQVECPGQSQKVSNRNAVAWRQLDLRHEPDFDRQPKAQDRKQKRDRELE